MRILWIVAVMGGVAVLPASAAPGIGGGTSAGLLQESPLRDGPRCFMQARQIRFIDRFGRPRVRLVRREVCR